MAETNTHPHQRWLPVRLGPADTTNISVILAIGAFIRAYDYLTGDDAWHRASRAEQASSPSLVGIEAAFPLQIWGVALALGAIIMLVGMVRRRHLPVFIGHAFLSVIYLGLFVGLMKGYVGIPQFDGIRGAVGLLVPATYCFVVSIRMGVRPLNLWKA